MKDKTLEKKEGYYKSKAEHQSRHIRLATRDIFDETLNDKNYDFIQLVRDGIDFPTFINILNDSPFGLNEWPNFLHISENTLKRYKREQSVFDSLHSDKIIQIALLCRYGIEVFGTKEKFKSWLESIIPALGNIKPIELLDNSFGIEMVRDELTRIEHGVLA